MSSGHDDWGYQRNEFTEQTLNSPITISLGTNVTSTFNVTNLFKFGNTEYYKLAHTNTNEDYTTNITFDLGSTRTIKNVLMSGSVASGGSSDSKVVTIQGSTDNSTYTQIVTTGGLQAGTDAAPVYFDLSSGAFNYRYIRININRSGTVTSAHNYFLYYFSIQT